VTTYILRRVLYSIPVLFAASFLVFAMVSATGDPLGAIRMQPNISEESIQLIVEEKHLDDPIPIRYFYWLEEAVTEKFGSTVVGERPIWNDLGRVIGHTVQLVVAAELRRRCSGWR